MSEIIKSKLEITIITVDIEYRGMLKAQIKDYLESTEQNNGINTLRDFLRHVRMNL